jgi:hypothetical protein
VRAVLPDRHRAELLLDRLDVQLVPQLGRAVVETRRVVDLEAVRLDDEDLPVAFVAAVLVLGG